MKSIVIFCLCLFMSMNANAEPSSVEVVSRGDANANYALGLLKLALADSGRDYQLVVHEEAWTDQRLRQSLTDGTTHVTWTATSKTLEKELIPIRVPLYKGLLGYRVLIIPSANIPLFGSIETLAELKRYRYCQGRNWTDTRILQHNGFDVVTAIKYEGLFYMTDGQRCHAFPRGVHEPWDELKRRPDLDLVVDSHILLQYVMPFYLFVSPSRPDLARDIETGMFNLIKSGDFDRYFYQDSTVQNVFRLANFQKRKVFQIDNPELPPQTPLEDQRLWIRAEQLLKTNTPLISEQHHE